MTLYQVRHFWLPSNAWTLLYGLLPRWRAYHWPWLYWQVVVMFLTWVTILPALIAAAGWPLQDLRALTIALLCWGSSPILLSMSVDVFPVSERHAALSSGAREGHEMERVGSAGDNERAQIGGSLIAALRHAVAVK